MIPANEYVEMLSNPNWINGEIVQLESDKSYPLGILSKKQHLHFMHYKNFNEAVNKWKIRSSRVDMDNAYIILVETASCRYEDLQHFDSLPYKNKIALVHKEYSEISCSKVIKGYDGQNCNGEILSKKLYGQVNWKSFLEL